MILTAVTVGMSFVYRKWLSSGSEPDFSMLGRARAERIMRGIRTSANGFWIPKLIKVVAIVLTVDALVVVILIAA